MSNDKCYGETYSWVRGMESNGVGKGLLYIQWTGKERPGWHLRPERNESVPYGYWGEHIPDGGQQEPSP